MNARITNLDSAMVPVPGAEMLRAEVGATAAGVGALHEHTKAVLWTIDGGTARVRFDGTAATDTEGHSVGNGAAGTWSRRLAELASLIVVSGTPVFHGTQME